MSGFPDCSVSQSQISWYGLHIISLQNINIQSHRIPVGSPTKMQHYLCRESTFPPDTSERDKAVWVTPAYEGGLDCWGELLVVCGGGWGGNPLSLCKHNNNSSNTLLAALLMYFQAKTGIFASCVIYCDSHLHIKALISPSERVCAPVCVCVWVRGWGV